MPVCFGIDPGEEQLKIFFEKTSKAALASGDYFVINGKKWFIVPNHSYDEKHDGLGHKFLLRVMEPRDVFDSRKDAVKWFCIFVRSGLIKPRASWWINKSENNYDSTL